MNRSSEGREQVRSLAPLNENNNSLYQSFRKSDALQKTNQKELDRYSQMNDSTKISYGKDLIDEKNYYAYAATTLKCALGIESDKNKELRTEIRIKDNEINTFKHRFGELDFEAKKKHREQALQLSFSLDKDKSSDLADTMQRACIEAERLLAQKI